MDGNERARIKQVLRQRSVPSIVRKVSDDQQGLHVRLPFDPTNRAWLAKGKQEWRVDWNDAKEHWVTPVSWFADDAACGYIGLAKRCLERYGQLYIIQPYMPTKKCAPACMNAAGLICDCSCMGEHHGEGGPNADWFVVNEAFCVKTAGPRQVACRLVSAENGLPPTPDAIRTALLSAAMM